MDIKVKTTPMRVPVALEQEIRDRIAAWKMELKLEAARKLLEEAGEVA